MNQILHLQELGVPKHIDDILDWENEADEAEDDIDQVDTDDDSDSANTDDSDSDEDHLKTSDVWPNVEDEDDDEPEDDSTW
jgi:hypothetical protein